MQKKDKTFYITTPIYYVNDQPHIGHAYTTVACDAMARFMSLDGYDVRFSSGTDEHGQKVEKASVLAGTDSQTFTDRMSGNFQAMMGLLNIGTTQFVRTTEPRHANACQYMWQKMLEKGDIYLGTYQGWYSVRDEAYFGEDELTDGPGEKKRAPTGAECEWVQEESYFFRLSEYQEKLLDHYEKNPDFIMPSGKRSEVIAFVKDGLRDLSISRTTFRWGIPVPGDDRHIMYVWLDALTNYLTVVDFPNTDSTEFQRFWPADLHVIGKDILRFHAIYWPAFLLSSGIPLPRRIFAHGWWTIEGEKMSKSMGNAVDPREVVASYGLDQTRYFLLREVPFGNDGDFSRRALVQRINGDLANDYGNLVQRVLTMVARNAGGVVPKRGVSTEPDEALLAAAYALPYQLREEMAAQAFHRALEKLWNVIGLANRYVDQQAPWVLRRTNAARMEVVLWTLAETIRVIAIMTQPFMPGSSARILDQLGVLADQRDFSYLTADCALVSGAPLPPPSGVFPRYADAASSVS